MLIEEFRPSAVLEVLKYADFDQFRHATRIVKADSIPLQTAGFSAATARLRLPGCQIHLQRTFPRIVDALLEGGALVLFPMEQLAPVKMNGIDVDFPAIGFARGRTSYRATEWLAGTYVLIVFDSAMTDRGWPALQDTLRVFRLTPRVLASLQGRIRAMFNFVSRFPEDAAAPLVVDSMREELVEALDIAFASGAPLRSDTVAFSRQLKIVGAIDQLLEADPAAPIYSEALASQCGVSVRTLHNVTTRFCGVSLHQYLRMKRLWMVRHRLREGGPSLRIKSCALEAGFWHMGEFTSAYVSLFGEAPSHTLARARAA